MELVCTDCRTLWHLCDCPFSSGTGAWTFVNDQELEHYFQTGLVPDHKAELLRFADDPKPDPVPLIHPPVYEFVN